MRREDLYKEIKLSNLNESNVSSVAKSMLGGNLQKELAEKLTKESQGNPLFVVESLRMLHERESLIQENDQWRLSVNELGLPSKIKDIILQRLSTLARNQRRTLDVASVIGERFGVELLAQVLGQDTLELTETLESIAQATSLIFCGEELYCFDHAKSRDAIYEEISPVLKRGYHAKIAEKLEATSKREKLPFSELAYHYAQAGNEEKAVKYALAAGEDALARWSNSQAIKHFEYVLQNIQEGHAEEKRTALEGLGDAYAANYMYGEAIKTFDELAAQKQAWCGCALSERLWMRLFSKATLILYWNMRGKPKRWLWMIAWRRLDLSTPWQEPGVLRAAETRKWTWQITTRFCRYLKKRTLSLTRPTYCGEVA